MPKEEETAVSGIATALATASAPVALGMLRSYGKKRYDQFVASYTNLLDDFLKSSLHKCEYVKTLLNTEAPVLLSSIYVETVFEFKDHELSDANLIQKIRSENGAFAVTGFAGSGKSIFMKHATSTLIEDMLHHQRVPLFIEVRDLDFDKVGVALDEAIFSYCTSSDNRTTFDQFKVGLKEGLFIVLFDGVDEAPVDKLDNFLLSLNKFHHSYRQCSLVASVRPGTKLPNLTHFKVFSVMEMTLEQVEQVINKAPYNDKRRALLISSLRSGLYATHQSFLSNPLLVTIVLITFDDASRIPQNLTGFYSAAFDALFGRHDWSKGVFVRQHKTALEKQAFERVFTYFCYLSYFSADYVFDKERILELVKQSLLHAKLQCKASDYIEDCILAVCLLQVDEPKIIFVHRSFQEYFTAKFISQYSGPKLPRMLSWLANRSLVDNTFLMALQMNREGIARAWALEQSRNLVNRWKDLISNNNGIAVLKDCGVHEFEVDISTGDIGIITVDYSSGYGSVSALLALRFEFPETIRGLTFDGSVYKHNEFTKLPETTKRFLRSCTSGAITRIKVGNFDEEKLVGMSAKSIASQALARVSEVTFILESYLEEQDEFADWSDVISPFEIGGSII